MDWYALKRNRCPVCKKDFAMNCKKGMSVDGEPILICKCKFAIGEKRYSEIVSGMVVRDLENRKSIIE